MDILSINRDRLQADIEALAKIGRNDDYGIYRMAFSEADMQGRRWFKDKVNDAGLEFYQDGAANIHARYGWDIDKPSVMMGSHLDTVPAAGHLDGALGVVVALECLRCIKERGLHIEHPIEAVSFSDEEGRFGGMVGSQAIAGMLTPEKIVNAIISLGDGLDMPITAEGIEDQQQLEYFTRLQCAEAQGYYFARPMPAEQLMKYRAAHEKLPGHPELGLTPGVKFSSGRLGHIRRSRHHRSAQRQARGHGSGPAQTGQLL